MERPFGRAAEKAEKTAKGGNVFSFIKSCIHSRASTALRCGIVMIPAWLRCGAARAMLPSFAFPRCFASLHAHEGGVP